MLPPVISHQGESDLDIGYLYDMVLNELNHGRTAIIVGSVNFTITTKEELNRKYPYLAGKFGVCKSWIDGVAHIATRGMPLWAIKVFESHRTEAPEVRRWIK